MVDAEAEEDLKKIVFVGSKAEEIAHKMNRQCDIRLTLETRHFETERTLFLKTFKAEHQATLQRQQKIRERLRELRLKNIPPTSRTAHYENTGNTQAKVRLFVTESKNSLRKCSKVDRRAKSAPEIRKTSQVQFRDTTP